MDALIRIAETGLVPDPLVRAGIRRLLRKRLRRQAREAAAGDPVGALVERLRRAPIAVETDAANVQHYELPAAFFELMLGPHLKYSSCHWSSPDQSLEQAEAEMLRLTCERAGIAAGQRVLDLGCGWGSLALWIAERYPACRVTAVSNSSLQADLIRERAAGRELSNLEVLTVDINRLQPPASYDRIVSVEMLEHVRNHSALLARVANWLEPDGRVFVHVFCHRTYAYLFEVDGNDDWMARHFFTGGMMPSFDLLSRFPESLRLERQWTVGGTHYQRTLLAWLRNLDRRREEALEVLGSHYGRAEARLWLARWRLFLLASAELFGYDGGREWMVGHYLLEPPVLDGGGAP